MIELDSHYINNPYYKIIKYYEKDDNIFILSTKYLSIKNKKRNDILSFKLHKSINDIFINDRNELLSCSSKENNIKKWYLKIKTFMIYGQILYENKNMNFKGIIQPKNNNKLLIYYYEKLKKEHGLLILNPDTEQIECIININTLRVKPFFMKDKLNNEIIFLCNKKYLKTIDVKTWKISEKKKNYMIEFLLLKIINILLLLNQKMVLIYQLLYIYNLK